MSEFEFLGTPHIIAMSAVLAVAVILSLLVSRFKHTANGICITFAGLLLANEVVHWVWRLSTMSVEEFLRNNLPLHICGISVFAVMIALVFKARLAFEIAWFWGLVGATNAVITPQIEVGYPEYRFFQYFIVHGGIIVGALLASLGLGMRPRLMSLVRAFALLIPMCAIVFTINLMLGSNYMFLMAPPVTESPFFFAPWPWYIPILGLFALCLFFLLLLPFMIRKAHHDDWPNP